MSRMRPTADQASSRSRMRCTNKQTDQQNHKQLLSKIHSCIKGFFINFLSTHRIWWVRSQGATPTPTLLSCFAKEQSSRNVNPSNCFFCFAASLTTDQQTYDGQEGLPESPKSFLLSFILSENRAIGHKWFPVTILATTPMISCSPNEWVYRKE